MKKTIQTKLESLVERHQEVERLLSQPEIAQAQDQFRQLSQEYAELEPVVKCFNLWQEAYNTIEEAEQLLTEDDAEMKLLGQQEKDAAQNKLEQLENDLTMLMLPQDPNDKKDVYLEIRAGTGGDEAALFVGDLFRMYSRYAEQKNWTIETVSASEGEHGGYKEIISRIFGQKVYSRLKFESGAHRVQRVPETESQGRIHTSACTVAIMPEADDLAGIDINKSDLRIDTFRSSGAGGQHVNTTDSAIRITHLPTGLVVECQDERSQHKNKAKALGLLQARLLNHQQAKQDQELSQQRKLLVGSGDRSERIRTYNYPQGRLTDHRINLTLYRLDEILNGSLDIVLDSLAQEHQADLLANLGSQTDE